MHFALLHFVYEGVSRYLIETIQTISVCFNIKLSFSAIKFKAH